eukprot:1966369-Amphidinium_carterae.1
MGAVVPQVDELEFQVHIRGSVQVSCPKHSIAVIRANEQINQALISKKVAGYGHVAMHAPLTVHTRKVTYAKTIQTFAKINGRNMFENVQREVQLFNNWQDDELAG